MAKNVAKKKANEIVEDFVDDIESAIGGAQSDNMDDRGTALLYIAQKMSPQLDKNKAEYIEGLQEGFCFNNLTGRFWNTPEDPLLIYPVYFRVNWLEFTPRDDGGGFHGMHPRDVDMESLGAQQHPERRDIFELPNGHELIETMHYYCLMADDLSPLVVPMASTNQRASQQLQAFMAEREVAFRKARAKGVTGYELYSEYFKVYGLRTVYAQNDKGSWYRYSPSVHDNIPEDDFELTMQAWSAFSKACKADTVAIAPPSTEDAGEVPI